MLYTKFGQSHVPVRSTLLTITFLLAAASPMFCQVVPDYVGERSFVTIGGSFSTYNVDLGHARMEGPTFWSDWQPNLNSPSLRGLGIETQVRDLTTGGAQNQPAVYRIKTLGGGLIYALDRFRNFRPYGKLLLSYGEFDWNNPNPAWRNESRTVWAPGFGFDARIHDDLWFRAGYEYQFWPDIDAGAHGDTINPQGFNFGVAYHIQRVPMVR